jgi:hypothetical protein
MPTFNMYLDQKITTWMRTEFNVEAETIEEAKRIAIEKLERGDLDEIGWEEVENTQEVLQPRDNGGCSTAELYYWDDVAKGNDEFYSNKINLAE